MRVVLVFILSVWIEHPEKGDRLMRHLDAMASGLFIPEKRQGGTWWLSLNG